MNGKCPKANALGQEKSGFLDTCADNKYNASRTDGHAYQDDPPRECGIICLVDCRRGGLCSGICWFNRGDFIIANAADNRIFYGYGVMGSLVLLYTAAGTFLPVNAFVGIPIFIKGMLYIPGVVANGTIGIAIVLEVMVSIAALLITTGTGIPVTVFIRCPLGGKVVLMTESCLNDIGTDGADLGGSFCRIRTGSVRCFMDPILAGYTFHPVAGSSHAPISVVLVFCCAGRTADVAICIAIVVVGVGGLHRYDFGFGCGTICTGVGYGTLFHAVCLLVDSADFPVVACDLFRCTGSAGALVLGIVYHAPVAVVMQAGCRRCVGFSGITLAAGTGQAAGCAAGCFGAGPGAPCMVAGYCDSDTSCGAGNAFANSLIQCGQGRVTGNIVAAQGGIVLYLEGDLEDRTLYSSGATGKIAGHTRNFGRGKATYRGRTNQILKDICVIAKLKTTTGAVFNCRGADTNGKCFTGGESGLICRNGHICGLRSKYR